MVNFILDLLKLTMLSLSVRCGGLGIRKSNTALLFIIYKRCNGVTIQKQESALPSRTIARCLIITPSLLAISDLVLNKRVERQTKQNVQKEN